jgi:hypothetical protein
MREIPDNNKGCRREKSREQSLFAPQLETKYSFRIIDLLLGVLIIAALQSVGAISLSVFTVRSRGVSLSLRQS